MASQAQIDANRRNSQRSTGPKTEAGKAHAKLNAQARRKRQNRTPRSCHRKTPSRWSNASTNGSSTSTDATTPNESWSSRPPSWPGPSTGPSGARPRKRPNASARRCTRPINSGTKKSVSWAAGCCTTPRPNPCPPPDDAGKTTRPPFSRGSKSSTEGCRWLLDHWIWDRSPKWSQFRSTGRQRAWWLDRA